MATWASRDAINASVALRQCRAGGFCRLLATPVSGQRTPASACSILSAGR